MFIFRVTGKTIGHFEVFPGYAIRRRFSGKKIRASKWCVKIIRNPTIFLVPLGEWEKNPIFYFLLYYITCTILYDVDVVKNAENIEIYEKA